ncbi:MAG: prephenate dehydrogenase/arogenate dehydrogenase family protein [Candidatus Omnitrophica bacterium]|nr:prephenate dehydrogenase/arogenate dehydrogenase family protein [Candidatus Omnitrophota bacterium]
MFRKELFRKVTIVGVGLIGASIGMAMRKKNLAKEIVGVARKDATLEAAKEQGAIHSGTKNIKDALKDAELIILAAPVNAIIEAIPVVNAHGKRGAIVTDVGSTKALIVDQAQKNLHPSFLFVGSHPIAGSEKSGPQAGSADLFVNTTCVMTPTEKTNRLAKEKVKHFWTQLGAHVKFMPPAEHDEVFACISHLPHVMAYSLAKSIPEQYLSYTTQSLRDTTRIAGSDPKMWNDICVSNTKNILKALDEYAKVLGSIRKAIVDADQQGLTDTFTQAKAIRERLEKS